MEIPETNPSKWPKGKNNRQPRESDNKAAVVWPSSKIRSRKGNERSSARRMRGHERLQWISREATNVLLRGTGFLPDSSFTTNGLKPNKKANKRKKEKTEMAWNEMWCLWANIDKEKSTRGSRTWKTGAEKWSGKEAKGDAGGRRRRKHHFQRASIACSGIEGEAENREVHMLTLTVTLRSQRFKMLLCSGSLGLLYLCFAFSCDRMEVLEGHQALIQSLPQNLFGLRWHKAHHQRDRFVNPWHSFNPTCPLSMVRFFVRLTVFYSSLMPLVDFRSLIFPILIHFKFRIWFLLIFVQFSIPPLTKFKSRMSSFLFCYCCCFAWAVLFPLPIFPYGFAFPFQFFSSPISIGFWRFSPLWFFPLVLPLPTLVAAFIATFVLLCFVFVAVVFTSASLIQMDRPFDLLVAVFFSVSFDGPMFSHRASMTQLLGREKGRKQNRKREDKQRATNHKNSELAHFLLHYVRLNNLLVSFPFFFLM